MVDIKRPVIFSGENPGMTLVVSETEQIAAIASYWHCTDSLWGVGRALILWLAPDTELGRGGIFTDNLNLARALTEKLTQYFPEFQNAPIETLEFINARCEHNYDGYCYQVLCQTPNTRVELEWADALDRKQIVWRKFPAGKALYDLTTVIRPCRIGHIKINGNLVKGEAKTTRGADGSYSSTAFLAFAETWVGPLEEKSG